MKKRRIAAAVLAASMVAGVTACGSSNTAETTSQTAGTTGAETGKADTNNAEVPAGGNTTITFWHSMGGVNGEAMDYLVNKFNEENTDGILGTFCCGE